MSLGHSSICGASDTLLSGSVRVQKSEGVFFHSWSWCTWHHIGVSLLSDLCWFFWVDVSVFTWNQVRCSGQIHPCWCSQGAACAGAGVSEQCNPSLPARGKRVLTVTFPGQSRARASRDSTAQLLHLRGIVAEEVVWGEHCPQVDSPFPNYHHPAVVLGCSTEDSGFFPLWSFIV